jgi:sensor domain CHASE-containing protein
MPVFGLLSLLAALAIIGYLVLDSTDEGASQSQRAEESVEAIEQELDAAVQRMDERVSQDQETTP